MKIIELNIGLSSKTLGNLNSNSVLNALIARGFTPIKYQVVESSCKDGKERCLAVKAEAPADWQEQIASLSEALGQDCIAVVCFVGHSPYDTFIAPLWKSPVVEDTIDGYTRDQFKAYLRDTIIPDSEVAGYEGYARDLTTALLFLNN